MCLGVEVGFRERASAYGDAGLDEKLPVLLVSSVIAQ